MKPGTSEFDKEFEEYWERHGLKTGADGMIATTARRAFIAGVALGLHRQKKSEVRMARKRAEAPLEPVPPRRRRRKPT